MSVVNQRQEVVRSTMVYLGDLSLGSTANTWIGRSQWPDPYLDGQVDAFRIYNRALSSSEVTALYNQ